MGKRHKIIKDVQMNKKRIRFCGYWNSRYSKLVRSIKNGEVGLADSDSLKQGPDCPLGLSTEDQLSRGLKAGATPALPFNSVNCVKPASEEEQ